MKIRQKRLVLIFILALAFLFRFYNFTKLQYFSVDDDLVFVIIRKMVREKRLVLISPNEATGLTLGSFFHILSLPFFLLVNGSPVLMGIFASLLGVATTYLIYRAGSLINQRIGWLASFFYAGSFLISLFDRRFWALTPNSCLAILAFIGLYKIVENKEKKTKNKDWPYPGLFIFASLFAWHSDLSLLVILLTGILVFLFFKINPLKKKYIPAFLLLLFSLAPLIFFELRHDFVNFKAIQIIWYRIHQKTESILGFKKGFDLDLFLQTFLRIILTRWENIKNHFHYGVNHYPSPLFPFFSQALLVFSLLGFLKTLRQKTKKQDKTGLKIIAMFMFGFILGFIIYTLAFSGRFSQHYFTVIFPIFCLFLAIGFDTFWQHKKLRIFVYLSLLLFLSTNLYTLFKAQIKHPIEDKIKAIASVKKYIEKDKFAAYDFGFPEGGMHYLYAFNGLQPVKCATYDCWYWIYMTNGLFEITPQAEWPEKVVLMLAEDIRPNTNNNIIVQTKNQGITMVVFDNTTHWISGEKLEKIILEQ